MAQTQRTVSTVYSTYINDNTTGDIVPEDVRDALETWRPRYAGMYITAAAAVSETVSIAGTYYEIVTPTWVLDADVYEFSEGTNGRLQYDGTQTVIAHITATASVLPAASDTVRIRLGIDGVTDPGTEAAVGASAVTNSVTCSWVTQIASGSYISLWVTSAGPQNVTVGPAQVTVVSMPA